MDFQGFVNTFGMACAVLSVQKVSNRRWGEIRIVSSNDIYKGSVGVARYRDNIIYSELVPKDSKFEDFCFRSAVHKKNLHAYVPAGINNSWADITFIPLSCEENDLAYCAFFIETTRKAIPEKMADVSVNTACDVIKSCITLRGSSDYNQAITSVIEDIQEKADAFCATIILIDSENRKFDVLCEKFRNNVAKISDFSTELTYNIVATWERTIGKSNGIIILGSEDIDRLGEKNPQWAYSLKLGKVDSVILYPLKQSNKTIGYLFITNFDTSRIIELKELIELTAFFLSSEISSHMYMKRLELMSSTDFLTGVKNRSAMNQRIDSFVHGEEEILPPFGIVFICVNGLKEINNENGHEAGDLIIKRASLLLKEIFWKDEIYRSAGDEFAVICPACQEDEFMQKVQKLAAQSGVTDSVCLSIGYDWNEEGKKLRRSMHNANEIMKHSKELLIKEHGESLR
ncbi:MAG: GGDEF domain-containing protein [Treponema sp.]|nr:GGDEF domain-containing protein [Treponema sp.]